MAPDGSSLLPVIGTPASPSRPTTMKVARSSKPCKPFASTRTSVGDSTCTRMSPTIAALDGATAAAVQPSVDSIRPAPCSHITATRRWRVDGAIHHHDQHMLDLVDDVVRCDAFRPAVGVVLLGRKDFSAVLTHKGLHQHLSTLFNGVLSRPGSGPSQDWSELSIEVFPFAISAEPGGDGQARRCEAFLYDTKCDPDDPPRTVVRLDQQAGGGATLHIGGGGARSWRVRVHLLEGERVVHATVDVRSQRASSLRPTVHVDAFLVLNRPAA